MYVVYQSPLVMLAGYPEAYDHNPGMNFLAKGEYEAQIFADGPDADSAGTSLTISTK
jgi:hypothetical protein